uniref:hypothetical protein n=1 Tax=Psychrobacter sp. TaxID=56811 RepID=UPI0025F61B15
KVLTGWVKVDDSRVWDCVVEISTTKAVYLNEQRATEQLFPDKSTIDSLSFKQDVNQMNEKSHNKVLNIADKNSVVFYSSAEPQLSKLWQLMCDSDNPIIGANSIHNTQKFESKLSKSYWLTSSQSKLDESITKGFSINHWKIIGEANATANLTLKEVYAKWQDQ